MMSKDERRHWRDAEMARLLDEGVLEVVIIRRKRKPQSIKIEGRYVYLMQAGDAYKIGYATRPETRRADIQVGCPLPVEILYQVRTAEYVRLERKLHHRFAHRRITGEWFRLTALDLGVAADMLAAAIV